MSTRSISEARSATRLVERAASKHARARVELEAAMRAARLSGLTWQQLADASGYSVEGVRKIVARAAS